MLLSIRPASRHIQSKRPPYSHPLLALGIALAIGATPPLPVFAQEGNPSAGAQQSADDIRQYNVDGGSLDAVLNRFALQAGLELSVAAELTRGKTSDGLSGRYSMREGLQQLLAHSGLMMRFTGENSVTIELVSQGGVQMLPPVKVLAKTLGTTTEETGSYTTGITSTATKLNLSLRETPQSVSVVTRQQIDDQNLTSVVDVLERGIGITTNKSESDRFYLYARGFDIMQIQYDGVPSLDNFGYETDLLSDAAIYDRVEIVRGATGLLTGTGEPSAAINLVRKRPTEEFQGHTEISTGRWDDYRGEIDLSGSLTTNGNIRSRFVGTYTDNKSYLDHYNRDLTGLYGILEADLTENLLLTFGVDYQESHTNGVTYGAPVPMFFFDGSRTDFPRSTTTAADWTSLDQNRTISFLGLEKSFGSGWLTKLQYSYREGEADPTLIYIGGSPDPNTGAEVFALPNSYDSNYRQNSVDLYATGPFTLFERQHELVLGYTYRKRVYSQKWHPVVSSDVLGRFFNRESYPEPQFGGGYDRFNDQDTQEDGVYLTTRWQLTDPLAFISGVRLTNYEFHEDYAGALTSTSYSSEWTPYAGLIYDFSKHYSAYASYTDIFQPQTSRDRDNVILDPRTGTNYEVGVKGEFYDGLLNLSAAIFKVEQDNLAELDVIIDGESRYKAVEGATVRGFELEATGELTPGWNITGGFTRIIAKDVNGEAIKTMEPQNLLRLTSSYKLPGALSKLTLGGHVTWQSQIYEKDSRPGGGNGVQESYALLHLFGKYQATEKLSFQVNLNNVFDKVYYAGLYSGGYARYGDPRNLMLTAKYKF